MNDSKIEKAIMNYHNPYDQNNISTFLNEIKIKADNYKTEETYRKCLQSMDITSLHTTDNVSSVSSFTSKVNELSSEFGDYASVAAICVYPSLVSVVKENLTNSNVKIAAVSGGFPHSQTFMEIKESETLLALNGGADEIDIVMSVVKFLDNDLDSCAEEIYEIKNICKEKTLKVILETGALSTLDNIYKASVLALEAGADFIKTSTGKQEPAATPEAAIIMCQAVKDFYSARGEKRGVKFAGGIRTSDDAVLYYTIVREMLSDTWLNQQLFRIGASSLANSLLSSITGETTVYF